MFTAGILIGLVVCLTGSSFAKPPVHIPPKNPNDPVRLPPGTQKSVLIIGKYTSIYYYLQHWKIRFISWKISIVFKAVDSRAWALLSNLPNAATRWRLKNETHELAASCLAYRLRYFRAKSSMSSTDFMVNTSFNRVFVLF